MNCRMLIQKIEMQRPFKSKDNRAVTLPGTKRRTILNTVLVIQNSEDRRLAPYGVAMPVCVAYVGIQLANPTSDPM